ncbi:MAG: polysaccharide export protein [Steroidobacteraceae bacterium]
MLGKTIRVTTRTLAPLLILSCLAGAVVAQDAPPPPAAAPDANKANRTDYIIGPGDSLQVFVWRNPELSVTVPVRPDGKISTPLVEDMVAIGKSPSQLARDIETVLSEYVRTPQVNIIVNQAVSAYSQVQVVGQVRSPQSIAFREGLKVLDVILASGGLTEFASGNRAKIVREVQGQRKEIRVKLADLMNRGDMRQNLELRPGDVLIVPQTFF